MIRCWECSAVFPPILIIKNTFFISLNKGPKTFFFNHIKCQSLKFFNSKKFGKCYKIFVLCCACYNLFYVLSKQLSVQSSISFKKNGNFPDLYNNKKSVVIKIMTYKITFSTNNHKNIIVRTRKRCTISKFVQSTFQLQI